VNTDIKRVAPVFASGAEPSDALGKRAEVSTGCRRSHEACPIANPDSKQQARLTNRSAIASSTLLGPHRPNVLNSPSFLARAPEIPYQPSIGGVSHRQPRCSTAGDPRVPTPHPESLLQDEALSARSRCLRASSRDLQRVLRREALPVAEYPAKMKLGFVQRPASGNDGGAGASCRVLVDHSTALST
jgi:hypothetical protein